MRISPELPQLFRDEEIGYSQLKAFTIYEDTDETALLGILDDLEVIYLDRIIGS